VNNLIKKSWVHPLDTQSGAMLPFQKKRLRKILSMVDKGKLSLTGENFLCNKASLIEKYS
jgi:hypothetical protein